MPAVDESEAAVMLERHAFSEAAAWVLRAYGSEIMTYILSIEPAPDEARDVFSDFCVALCEGLPRFRNECSLRTWAYALARRRWARSVRTRVRRRAEAPLTPEVEAVAEHVRTVTAEYLRSDARARLLELRARLDPSDQSLLVLRLHRNLSWTEIARVLRDDDDATGDDLAREAAALRKRYERLKEQFRRQLRGEP